MKYLRLLLVIIVLSSAANGSIAEERRAKPLFLFINACGQPVAIVLVDPDTGRSFISSVRYWKKSKTGIGFAREMAGKMPKSKSGKSIVKVFNVENLICNKSGE